MEGIVNVSCPAYCIYADDTDEMGPDRLENSIGRWET